MDQTPVMFEHDLETIGHRMLYRYRDPTVTELALATIPHPSQPGSFIKELREVRLRSVKSEQHTIIHFWNQTDVRVCALWINFSGSEIAYSIFDPGEKKRYRTYATHPWIIRDARTRRRLIINDSEVLFGQPEPTEAIIRNPPLLEWNERSHTFFPWEFKERVKVFLLCHNHLRRWVQPPLEDVRTLGGLPSEVVNMIVVQMMKECEVEQTLVRGILAAPDLKPVELPWNVPIEEFIPATPSEGSGSTDSNDSETITDDEMEE